MKKAMMILLAVFVVIFLTDIMFLVANLVNIGEYQKEWYETGVASVFIIIANLSFLITIVGYAISVVFKTYHKLNPDEKKETEAFLTKIFERILLQMKKRQDNFGKITRIIG